MPVPPFTLAALETSIGKRLAVPAYEIRMIAAEIYDRYEYGGPFGSAWYTKRVTLAGGGSTGYDLCRGERFGGVYFSEDEAQARSLADALNELENTIGSP